MIYISRVIPTSFAALFSSVTRARGEDYARSGRVRIIGESQTSIDAVVHGTRPYFIAIDVAAGFVSAQCDCPFAADQGLCKHVWATLRYAEGRRSLGPLLARAGAGARLIAGSSLTDGDEDDDDDFDDDDGVYDEPAGSEPDPRRIEPVAPWKATLAALQRDLAVAPPVSDAPAAWPEDRRPVYVIDLPLTARSGAFVVELAAEKRGRATGAWEPPSQFRLGIDAWLANPDPVDRQIAQMLLGAAPPDPYGRPQRTSGFMLRGPAVETTLRLMCDSGRCRLRLTPGERPTRVLAWDNDAPWRLRLQGSSGSAGSHSASAVLERHDEQMPLSEPALLLSDGYLVARGAISRFDHRGAFAVVRSFRERPVIDVADGDFAGFLDMLYAIPRLPPVDLPPGSGITEAREAPRPCLTILPDTASWRAARHRVVVGFRYGARRIDGGHAGTTVFDPEARVLRHRDRVAEATARSRLPALGVVEEWDRFAGARCQTIAAGRLAVLVLTLVGEGWEVDMSGAPFRTATSTRATVRSGVDWFELDAGARFGDLDVSLADLLAARRAGQMTIVLPDGSQGILPAEWLAKLGPIAAGGTIEKGSLRYGRSQVALLDALLSTIPEANVDATFEKARAQLRGFERVEPADPPPTFTGTLRGYQREGLGWLHFLRQFNLGGCLADDMGLGKTIQVLALLDARRATRGKSRRPSIAVVPRSLVFNWMREAARFTPRLRVLDHSGSTRRIDSIDAAHVDLVITTYGTLRRDAAELSAIEFDYAILDEAQAIKNAGSASAKAARLLKAEHRLAMTGTPIENRLEELWSLFEFLNPGMLGASSTFASLLRLSEPGGEVGVAAGREVLARALRPVILRRTKEQVATDLPARTEQTLSVELPPAQRKFYDGLLESYRRSVLDRVDRDGVSKARMHILEALLRLRQAACHPALADPRKREAPSAKLDALLPAIDEVIAQGHKVLVFSQFTSFLDLVRARLDAAGTVFEYLDGRTRNRQARVDRFQDDADCRVFLISLKAGGHGLNLTAADYVYILDPWWNPAVEAQAIDRAHRIGQSRHVIATRIVARDTIEEKILELQASKRALADAILGQDQGVLAQIGRAELEMLLR
jgi:superfamily II DNA or RNA helicase